METDVSVITTFYEGEKYIRNLCKMIYANAETLHDINSTVEFVIVNDSPWEKVDIPEKYSVLNIKIYNNPRNLGIHQSRVNGIRVAHGKYVLMLDQDDTIADDCLKEHLKAICNNDICVCNGYKELNNKNKVIYKDKIKFSLVKNPLIYLKAANQIVSPGQCLLRKTSIPNEWMEYTLKNNGSDDLFLWLLCLSQKKSFKLLDKKMYVHNQDGNNLSNDLKKMCQSDMELCEISKREGIIPESYLKKRIRLCKFIKETHYTQRLTLAVILKYPDIIALKIFAYFA